MVPGRPERDIANEALKAAVGGCKYCGSPNLTKYGTQAGKQRFQCGRCRKVFANPESPPRMRTPRKVIAGACELFYSGESLRKASRNVGRLLGVRRHNGTVHRWLVKYAGLVKPFLANFPADAGDKWCADETAIFFHGGPRWLWEVESAETRFILASQVGQWGRTKADATALFREAKRAAKAKPALIVTDRLAAYREGIRKNFYVNTDGTTHLNRIHFARRDANNNLIESFHGATVKQRTRTMRHFKRVRPASAILDGIIMHYNYLAEHSALDGQTPAQAAGIDLPFEDGWGDLIRWATAYDTLLRSPKPAPAPVATEILNPTVPDVALANGNGGGGWHTA